MVPRRSCKRYRLQRATKGLLLQQSKRCVLEEYEPDVLNVAVLTKLGPRKKGIDGRDFSEVVH